MWQDQDQTLKRQTYRVPPWNKSIQNGSRTFSKLLDEDSVTRKTKGIRFADDYKQWFRMYGLCKGQRRRAEINGMFCTSLWRVKRKATAVSYDGVSKRTWNTWVSKVDYCVSKFKSRVKQYVLFRTITVQSAYSCPVTHTCTPVFTDIEMWSWLKMRYVLRYNHVCAMSYDIIMCVHAGIGLHITHGGQSWAMVDKLHW